MDKEESPFVEDWPDARYQQIYRLHSQQLYEQLKEYRADSRRYHVEYGKWLIASLLAVHGGAIVAAGNVYGTGRAATEALASAVSWNVAGIVSILLAGCMAWANFQAAELLFHRQIDPAMLYRRDRWPTNNEKTDPLRATLFLALFFGGFSIFAFVVSALEVLRAITMAPPLA